MFRLWVFAVAVLLVGAVGCKRTPAYVGSYGIVVDDAMQKKIDTVKAMMSKASKSDQDKVQKQIDSVQQVTLTINADGTFSQSNAAMGHSVQGTYTVDGDKLTLSATDPQSKQSGSITITFHEADKTLTMGGGSALPITLKKK